VRCSWLIALLSQYMVANMPLPRLYPWYVISIEAPLCLRVVVTASIKTSTPSFPTPTRDMSLRVEAVKAVKIPSTICVIDSDSKHGPIDTRRYNS
jgi:hypothetical protein